MKKLIVLSTALLLTGLTLTGCWNTEKEPAEQPAPETAVTPADTVAKPVTETPATVAPDSLTENK